MRDAYHKKWYLVETSVTRRIEEVARSLLFDLGTSGILTMWEGSDRITLGAYFELEPKIVDRFLASIEAEFARTAHGSDLLHVRFSEVPEEDWMQKWKAGFEHVDIGRRLTVGPSWKEAGSKHEGRISIKIDPGMAFGTGTHETTRLALDLIERNWRGGSFLDVGTGTGILAIAAALLAPDSSVIAIDVDPVAVDAARDNVLRNEVLEQVKVREGRARSLAGRRFDMLAANLTAESIVAELPELARCVAPSGSMVLSGILSDFARDVERAGRNSGLVSVERNEAAEWTAFVMRFANALRNQL